MLMDILFNPAQEQPVLTLLTQKLFQVVQQLPPQSPHSQKTLHTNSKLNLLELEVTKKTVLTPLH